MTFTNHAQSSPFSSTQISPSKLVACLDPRSQTPHSATRLIVPSLLAAARYAALQSPAPLSRAVQSSPQRGGAPVSMGGMFSGRSSAPARDDALVGRTFKVKKGPFRCGQQLTRTHQ